MVKYLVKHSVTWSALVKLQPTLQVENRRISPPFLKEALRSSEYKVINCMMTIAVSDEIVLIKAPAKISFNIILLNLAVGIIGIFLLIDLFVFSL